MTRRHFIRAIAALVAATSGIGCASIFRSAPKTIARAGFPIVQGLTNATAAQFAVVAPREAELHFSFSPLKGDRPFTADLSSEIRASSSSSTVVHHLKVTGLSTGTVYRLDVRRGAELIDTREFTSLDVSRRPARIIAASCLYDLFLKESVAMWKSVADAKPDLLLLIGDNVYAEVSNGRFPSPLNEAALWTRYTETFSALDFYRLNRLIPTLVTWDDHDYGMKDGDFTNPHKVESKKVMESFFAQTPSKEFPEFHSGPGVSSIFDAFGYRFMLLDDRSFRSTKPDPNAALIDPHQTHFGAEQENWILKNVEASQDPVWLISGDQWFGSYHRFESYEGTHPESFKKFFARLKQTDSTVMFMSGDRHLSEVNKVESELLGYETFEFTSSSLHSKAHPANWDSIPNRRHVRGIDMVHSFILFELTPSEKHVVKLKGEAIGTQSKVLYEFQFDVTRRASKRARE